MSSAKKTNRKKKIDRQNKLALNNITINNESDFIILKKKLIKNSLFIFTKENCFRNLCLRVSTNNIFLQFINLTVLISSIFLVLETFEDKKILKISTIFGLVFWGIYVVEFLLKTIAFGFCLGENTYLTDAWNVLDLLIIVSGAVSLLPQVDDNLYFLRVLKIVRPLKALTAIPNMKGFISTLLLSLMDLFIVFIILLFFLIFFALIGLSLWSDIFDYRCRSSLLPVNGTLPVDPKFTRLCGGENLCNANEQMCLSSKDLWDDKLYFFNAKSFKNNFDKELYTEKLNYGLTTFRNFFHALCIVFQVTTMEGWGNIMFIVMSAHNSVLAAMYFISLIILNNYFMLNLLVAILLFNFEKNYQNTVKEEHFLFRFSLPLLGRGGKKLPNNNNNNAVVENNLNAVLNDKKTRNSEFSVNNAFEINVNNVSKIGKGFVNNFNSVVAYDDKNISSSNSFYFNDDLEGKFKLNNFDKNKKIESGNKLTFSDKSNSGLNLDENAIRQESDKISTNNNVNYNSKNNKNRKNIKDTSCFSRISKNNKSKFNENSFENISKKSNEKETNLINFKRPSDKSFLSANNKTLKSLVDPVIPDSARMLLNEEIELLNERENQNNFETKLNEAEVLIEEVLFYSKDELSNVDLIHNNYYSNNNSNKNLEGNKLLSNNNKDYKNYNLNYFENKKENQLNKSLDANDNLVLNTQPRFKLKSDCIIQKYDKNLIKNIENLKGFDLSYLNYSPKYISDKAKSDKTTNDYLVFGENKISLQNHQTEKNKYGKNSNERYLEEKNNDDNKILRPITEFTVIDKNSSANFLLKKMNNKNSQLMESSSFENNTSKINKNTEFKSNIFTKINNEIKNNPSKKNNFDNILYNYNTQKISNTELLNNRNKSDVNNNLIYLEPSKKASLPLLPWSSNLQKNFNNKKTNLGNNPINNNNPNNNNNNNNNYTNTITNNNNPNNQINIYNNNNNNNTKQQSENKLSNKDFETLLRKYRKKYKKIKKLEKQKFDIFKPHTSFYKLIREIPFFIHFRKTSAYHKSNNLAFACYYIINQPIVRYFIYFCITFNFIILVIERKGQSESEINAVELLNKILVFIFIIECVFLVFSIGVKTFFKNLSNSIDFALAAFSLIELIFINEQMSNKSNKSVASSFKILRILRILKLIRSWHSFRIMILSIIDTVKRMGNYFILLFIFIYVYALMACNVFKGSLRFNKETNLFDKDGEQLYDNFDSFTSAFFNVFYLIIGDGWYTMFFDCLRSDANNSFITIAYFISLILIGQLCMLNIFMAYLIDNFKISRRELFKNIEVKNKIFNNVPKIGLERHRKELVRFHQRNRFKSPFLALVNFFAGEHEKTQGPHMLLKSKFNFEAKIQINFKNEEKSNQTYFRRQRNNNDNYNKINNKNNKINDNGNFKIKVGFSEDEKIKFDKSEDFEILYKNEAFYYNAKNDLLIDFEYIVNLETWRKEKLFELLNKKQEEILIAEEKKFKESELKSVKDNNLKQKKIDFELDSVAASAYGIIRNKTDFRFDENNKNYNKNNFNFEKNRFSAGIMNSVNKKKTFGAVNINHKIDSNYCSNEINFRELQSLSHYTKKNKIRKLEKGLVSENNNINNNYDDTNNNKKYDNEEAKSNNSSTRNLVKVLRANNELDFQESEPNNGNQNALNKKNSQKDLHKQSKYINLSDFECKSIPRFKNEKENNSDIKINDNQLINARDDYLNIITENKFKSADNSDEANIQLKKNNLIEKTILIPLKNFIKKYDFIQTESESESELNNEKEEENEENSKVSYEEKASKINDEGYEINFSSESNKHKYSLSNEDWELNNDISEENLHKITVKNYEIKAVYSNEAIDPNASFSLDVNFSKEKNIGKQIKSEFRKINSFNLNLRSSSKNSDLNYIENYFKDLDYKYNNQQFDVDLEENEHEEDQEKQKMNLNFNLIDDVNIDDVNRYILSKEHEREILENNKKQNFKNKVKINGDQIFLKPRGIKSNNNNDKNNFNNYINKNLYKNKDFFFNKLDFFGNENYNKEIFLEKKFSILKKAKTSALDSEEVYPLESIKIPKKTLTINNFSEKFSNKNKKMENTKKYFSVSPHKISNIKTNTNKNYFTDKNKLGLDSNFAIEKESNLSEELKDYISDNNNNFFESKINNQPYKINRLLYLKTEAEVIFSERCYSDDNISFSGNNIKNNGKNRIVLGVGNKTSFKKNIQRLIQINNNNDNNGKLEAFNLKNKTISEINIIKNKTNYSFDSFEGEYSHKQVLNSNSNFLKDSKANCKYSIEDLKDPEFIKGNKRNWGEILHECFHRSSGNYDSENLKNKFNKEKKFSYKLEKKENNILDIFMPQEVDTEMQEFIDFDIVIDKTTRNTLGKHKCRNIVECFALKNIFNLNENLKKDFYLNDAKLAEKINDLFILKKEFITRRPSKDLKSNFENLSSHKSTKPEINLLQVKLEDSPIRLNLYEPKSIDIQVTNGNNNLRKSIFAFNKKMKTNYENNNNNKLNIDQEIDKGENILIENKKLSRYINKHSFSAGKNNSTSTHNLFKLKINNGLNKTDSFNDNNNYKDFNNEKLKRSYFSNDFSSFQLKNHQVYNNKYNLNTLQAKENKEESKNNFNIETFNYNLNSNKNYYDSNNNKKFPKKINYTESDSQSESSLTSLYEAEEIFLLDLLPNAKTNIFSELKKTEFLNLDLEKEAGYKHMFIRVKNKTFFEISLKPFFAEYKYEKKMMRDRMSIFNLINTGIKKETLAYEALEKEINEEVLKATETVQRKSLSEYLKEKADAEEKCFLNKNNNKNYLINKDDNFNNNNEDQINYLQTFQSSLTKKHKFPFMFLNNPHIESYRKEKFLSIFFILNAKSWEIQDTEYNNKLKRKKKTQNFMEKLKTKIKQRNEIKTELIKKCFYSFYLQVKNHIQNSSIGIFHKESKIRNFFAKIILSNNFEFTIMIFILFNCIFLILDNPWNDPEGWLAKAILYTNTIFTFIFMAESIMKIIAFGLVFGQKEVLKDNKPKAGFPMEFIRNRKKNILGSNEEVNLNDVNGSDNRNNKQIGNFRNKSSRRVCILDVNDIKNNLCNVNVNAFDYNAKNDYNKSGTAVEICDGKRRRSNFSVDKALLSLQKKGKSQHSRLNKKNETFSSQNPVKQHDFRKGAVYMKANSDRNVKEKENDYLNINNNNSNNNESNSKKNLLEKDHSKSFSGNNNNNNRRNQIHNNSDNKLNKNNNFKSNEELNLVAIPKTKTSLLKSQQTAQIANTSTLLNNQKKQQQNLPSNAKEINQTYQNTNQSNQNTPLTSSNSISSSLNNTKSLKKGFCSSTNLIDFSQHSGYLSNLSNLIDFVVVILGFIDVISTDDIAAAKYLRTMRMMRSIRPIRIITKNENLKLILSCLIKSIPAIGNILIIGVLFILIYAVVGVDLFKNTMDFYCSDNQIAEESVCLEKGFDWLLNQQNFNNIFSALKTLFVTLTVQNWVWLMNLAYFKNNLSYSVYFYFISFIIFANFFILNLFVSVIVEKFKSLKDQKNKLFSLTEEERDWIKVQKIMLKFNPKIKLNESECSFWQMKIYKFISNVKFEIFSISFILIAILLLAVQYNGANNGYNNSLQIANYVISFIFNAELVLKLYVYRKSFFISRWNIFDFIIIMLCNLVLVLNILEQYVVLSNSSKLSTLPGIFRALRILRVLRLIAVYPNLRTLIDTLVYLVPSIGNIGLIMLILFTIYGCVGVNLFGTVPYRDNIHEYNNFRNFPAAVLLLFKVTTGDDWNVIMNELAYHDCRKLEDYLGNENFTDLNLRVVRSFYERKFSKNNYNGYDNNDENNKEKFLKMDYHVDARIFERFYAKRSNDWINFTAESSVNDLNSIHYNNDLNIYTSDKMKTNNQNYNNNDHIIPNKKKVSQKTYSVINRNHDYFQNKQNPNNNNKNEQSFSNNNNLKSEKQISKKESLTSFYHRNLQSFPNLTLSFNNTQITFSNKSLSKIESFLASKKQDYFCEMFKEVFCYSDENTTYAMLHQGIGFSCGTDFSYVYFISFVIIGPIFVMNLCVVIVVEGFSESMLENESLLSQSEMDKFISVWVNYDQNFSKTVKPYEMVLILKEIDPPLGLNYDRFFIHNPLKAWKNFKMKNNIRRIMESNVRMFIEEFKMKKKIEVVIKNEGDVVNSDDFNNNKKNYNNLNRINIGNINNKENDKNRILNLNDIELQQLESSSRNRKQLLDISNHNSNSGVKKDNYNDKDNKNNNHKADKNSINIANNQAKKEGLKITKKGHNTYNCRNFFFDQNLKFWTYNSEVIRIVDFFGFNAKTQTNISNNNINDNNEKNSKIDLDNRILRGLTIKEGILNNGIKNVDLYDGLDIHFVDACLSLSKYITSKKHSVFQDSLREKVVKNFTKNMWKKKFKLKAGHFESKKQNVLSENLSLRVLAKIKPKLKNMLENARRNIYLRKLNKSQ